MIEHLRNNSIVKVIPNDSKKSYYIVRVSEIFDQGDIDLKGISGIYKTFALGEYIESKVAGYPMPDMSGVFLENTNSFEVLVY